MKTLTPAAHRVPDTGPRDRANACAENLFSPVAPAADQVAQQIAAQGATYPANRGF